MPDDDLFSPFSASQRRSHCGPTSLASCLFLLGFDTDQDEIVKAAGLSRRRVRRYGMDEKELISVAARFGATAEEIVETEKGRGELFVARLRKHVTQGLPALLLVSDFSHWVTVIGQRESRFVIVDPLDEAPIFSVWRKRYLFRKAWNHSGDDVETPGQLYALCLRRRDGRPPRWRPTLEWLRLCRRGSEDTANNMAADLGEILEWLRVGETLPRETVLLGDFIRQHQSTFVHAITHWGKGGGAVSSVKLASFCRDYATIADATGARVPATVDRVALVAQVTAMLAAHWWSGEL